MPHVSNDGEKFTQDSLVEDIFTVIDKLWAIYTHIQYAHSHNSLQDHFSNPTVSPRHFPHPSF